MYYTSKLIQAKKKQSPSVQDGYWVHKDTDVKTYFGADADFIVDGMMKRPDWMANAKEVRLCTGTTGFEVYEPVEGFLACKTFATAIAVQEGMEILYSEFLEKLDFGDAEVETIPAYLTGINFVNPSYINPLSEVILNDNVTTIGLEAFYYCLALYNIDLGNKLTFIEAGAFGSISSSAIIISRNTTPPTLGYEAREWNQYPFGPYSESINRTFKVPSASVNAYKTATGWSTYANNIIAI